MKHFALTCLLFSCFLGAAAQPAKPNDKEVFAQNNLYVIYSGESLMDSAMKKSMAEYWKVNSLKGFVSKKEAESLIKDKSNSFIYPREWSYVIDRTRGTERSTSGVVCFNGGRKNFENLLYEAVTILPIDLYGYEGDMNRCSYRVPLMIRELNDYFLGNTSSKKNNIQWKKKTLLINENHVKGKKRLRSIKPEALATYPYKYELATEEKIIELINSKDENYILLTPILSDTGAFLRVEDLSSGQILSYKRKSTIFSTPWVREKEFEGLIELMR